MERFEIWNANVRFEDEPRSKERPVLIWNDMAFVIAYKMTGTDRGDDRKEFPVEFWREAGLTKPTFIRIEKMLRLQHSDLIRKVGVLDQRDQLRFSLRIAG